MFSIHYKIIQNLLPLLLHLPLLLLLPLPLRSIFFKKKPKKKTTLSIIVSFYNI